MEQNTSMHWVKGPILKVMYTETYALTSDKFSSDKYKEKWLKI